MSDWLDVRRGDAPLIVAFPHTGTRIPADIEARLVSPWLARKDADWRVDRLYDFAAAIGATTVRTAMSRSVIDVNRDPSGASLYPGQATTGLCPTETFDGEPLYAEVGPDKREIALRRATWFDPYHAAIAAEVARLKDAHGRVVLYDAHSIRSVVPRLFEGELAVFNIGTDNGATCAAELQRAVSQLCASSEFSHVVNGRFRGGWTTRRYGRPESGIHAIQMELAARAYLHESAVVGERNWPPQYDPDHAAPLVAVLRQILAACLEFAHEPS